MNRYDTKPGTLPPGRFGGEPPSTLQRQAMNALRRGELDRAAELFERAGDFEAAARCRAAIARLTTVRAEVKT